MESNVMGQTAANQQAMLQTANQNFMQQSAANPNWMSQLGENVMMQSANQSMQPMSNVPMMQSMGNAPMMQSTANAPMLQQMANAPMMQSKANTQMMHSKANMPMMQSMSNVPMMQSAENPPIQPMKSAGEVKDWCEKYKHRYVLAQTHDGQCYDGFIEHIDDEVVCLAVPCCSSPWDNRAFMPFGGPFGFPRRRFIRRVFPLTALVGLSLLPFLFF